MVLMREISAEKLSYVIAKAREMESGVKGNGANGSKRAAAIGATDDCCAAARAELTGFIEAMDEDEQCELIALAWVGRGKFTREEWNSALAEARAHLKQPTAEYLQRNPKLAPHLESGLAEIDHTGDGFEFGRH
jgi:DNA-binding LacI/PurR family transcriptional regulator